MRTSQRLHTAEAALLHRGLPPARLGLLRLALLGVELLLGYRADKRNLHLCSGPHVLDALVVLESCDLRLWDAGLVLKAHLLRRVLEISRQVLRVGLAEAILESVFLAYRDSRLAQRRGFLQPTR